MRTQLLVLLLWALLVAGDGEDNPNRCPHELDRNDALYMQGYRIDNETCATFVRIDWEQWNATSDYHDLWDKICNPVHGKPMPLLVLTDVPKTEIFQENLKALLGWFVTGIDHNEEYGGGVLWWYQNYIFDPVYGYFHNMTTLSKDRLVLLLWSHGTSWKTTYLSESKCDRNVTSLYLGTNHDIHIEWYNKRPSEQNPMFFSYSLQNYSSPRKEKPLLASEIQTAIDRPEFMTCQHKAWKNCIQHVVDACNLNPKLNKWIDKMLVVSQTPDTPWGKQCPVVDLDLIGKPCEQACLGTWSEWTPLPLVKCDNVTIYRYRPMKATDPPCSSPTLTCCVEQKTIPYPDKCSDFAYNSTINLAKQGCKNGAKAEMSLMRHLECVCDDRYTGIQCEIDKCESRCSNFVDCLPVSGRRAVCICKAGFEGPHCDDRKRACGKTGSCLNGGTCIAAVGNSGAYCKCPPMYGGESCEREAGGCTALSCNGHGVCYADKIRNSFKCLCDSAFTGDQCATSLKQLVPVVKQDTMGLPIGIGIGIIIALILFILMCRRHRHKKKRGKRVRSTSLSESVSKSPFSILVDKVKGSAVSERSTSRTSVVSSRKSMKPIKPTKPGKKYKR